MSFLLLVIEKLCRGMCNLLAPQVHGQRHDVVLLTTEVGVLRHERLEA